MTKLSKYNDDDVIPQEQAAALAEELIKERLLAAPAAISEMTAHLAASQGKGIRALLLTCCASDSKGNAPYSSVKAAAAIELIHMATLVHDDIIDDAPTRRGQPSVQSKFGKKLAVICGDWLLCAAMNLAVSIAQANGRLSENMKNVSMFASAVEKICLGELTQERENGNVDLTASGYLRIISQKTGALFYLAAKAGALLGNGSEQQVQLLVRYARQFGIIFQIADDIKDYSLNEAQTLKPVKSDLVSGVVTLPLILSLIREPSIRPLVLDAMRLQSDVQPLLLRINQSGGVEEARNVVRRYAKKAKQTLGKLDNPYQRDVLASLVEQSVSIIL